MLKEKRKIKKMVSRSMIKLLPIGLLATAILFSFPWIGVQSEEWVAYVPSAGQVELYYWEENGTSVIELSIEFPSTGYNISDWGIPTIVGYNVSADADIWDWTGADNQIVIDESHTYYLGNLPAGEYLFTFKAWGFPVKSTTFTVPYTNSFLVGEVKLRGNVITDEKFEPLTCYGSYYSSVMVDEVVYDPNGTLSSGDTVSVCYRESLSLKIGDCVECYGIYWKTIGPLQYLGHVVCIGHSYYVLRAPIYIRADGSIDPPTANIVSVDNVTYTFTDNIYSEIVVNRSSITIDGNGYKLQGAGTGRGFDLSLVSAVTIKNTHITGFLWGIYIHYDEEELLFPSAPIPCSNTIFNNIITNCSLCGIWIVMDDSTWTAHEHRIVGNIIRNNEGGVVLGGNTRYNNAYHNDFQNNSVHAQDSTDQTNHWNNKYPSGGNYWSDYNGTDLFGGPYQNLTGGDGIGDTPYVIPHIDGYNQDNYPLMEPPPSIPGDVNNDGIVDISDVVIAGKAFASHPRHPRWDFRADMNNDGGVDIFDLLLITKNFGKTIEVTKPQVK